MKKVALINSFFGEFPWYFPFFIKSCIANPTIDFFIFSDAEYMNAIPDNVKIIPFSLEQFNKLATQKIGFEIDIKRPYKLCEFKPAFGLLFSDYLHNYDFWGITDIDVVYGRIREFMNEQMLDSYDVICVRNDYITACCMLFRNTNYINSLFEKSKDYKKVFTNLRYFGFDETNFEQTTIVERHDIFKLECEIETMQHIILKEEEKGNLKIHFDLFVCDGNPGKMKWDNGLFSYNNKFEILLYHLQNYKNNFFSNKDFTWDEIPNIFYIDKYSFRKNNSLKSYLHFFYTDYIVPFWWELNKKIAVFLSIYFLKNRCKMLNEGIYFNILSKNNIIISKDENQYNCLKFMYSNEYELYQLIFFKNFFFAKGLNGIFEFKGNEKSFQIIAYDGFSISYTILESNEN
ncbi:DUF6625 family protein [Flavobacterium hibisci]|uniref:DUF6625 family protein n=1 Tax=Flavobacterium hibisci TaxID=1914462 RepID=UPI001CBEB8E7|nr:DUF6625 family protein [Flavobacterium hibisci]MBZ4042607.1 hypothetical protein [Flavobacterium hibisci]